MADWTHKRIPPGTPLADRLLIIGWDVTEAKCWEWRGSRSKLHGYGRIDVNRRRAEAHRVAYEVWVAPIPPGLVVMHSCDNPPCINPMHLSVGTQADNMADRDAKGRSPLKQQTHCNWGHEFTPENTYLSQRPNGSFHRKCKACTKRREQTRGPRRRTKPTSEEGS